MKEFRTLRLLDRFRGPLERMGVQYPELRLILQVKLTMDARRVPTIITGSSSRNKKGTLLGGVYSSTAGNGQGESSDWKNRFAGSLWIYALIGLVLIPFLLMGDHYLFQMTFVFSIIFFMVTGSLISDFSSVLLDIRDKAVLLSRPVNSRTVNLAKVIHVFVYMTMLTAAITLPSLLTALFKKGAAFLLLYAAEIIWMDFLVIALTALLYFLVLRFFNGEVLKDIINYVQIGLTIGITIGYQLVFRLFDLTALSLSFEPKWWQYLLPPVWFAGPFEVLFNGRHSGMYLAFALLALIVPLLALALYFLLMPLFEKNLQKLAEQSGPERRRTIRFNERIGSWICRTKDEASFYNFASIMMAREREFKLKVYPSLGFSIIFPFIFMLTNLNNGLNFAELSSGNSYLFIYFCALMIPTVVMMLKYSGKYKGAWIFEVIPVKNLNDVYKGTLKAFLVRLFIPLFIVEAIIFTAIFGFRIVPDLITVLISMFLYTYISYLLLGQDLPFTEPLETARQNRSTLKIFGMMALLGGFALIHLAALRLNYGVYLYMLVLLGVNVYVWGRGFAFRSRGA